MLRLFSIAVLLYLIILAGLYIFLYQKGYIGPGFFEHFSPDVEIQSAPAGIGVNPAKLSIRISDPGAGLDEVIIRAQQAKRKLDLLTKFYQKGRQKEDEIDLEINGQEQKFREGTVEITIHAFDRSFFNNRTVKTLELPVDYRKPRLEVLSAQHNANQGGVEFAFYKLMDGTAVDSGVIVGRNKFPGYPAKLIEPGFENMPEVFFSFFAIPAEFHADNGEAIAAFASNKVGNVNLSSFYYHISKRAFRSKDVKIPDYIMRAKLEEVLVNTNGDPESLPLDDAGLAGRFAEMQKTFNSSLFDQFSRLAANTARTQFWRVPFQRPIGGAIMVGFGEKRNFFCGDFKAGEEQHAGLDLSSSLRNSVFAVNDGQVVFAGYLGMYGNTVVIDHGFALFSVYAHLSSFSVKEGDHIIQGTELGRTGVSGFSDSDHLHFEMRLMSTPVNPVEWWDTRWINDHIIAKTHGILGQSASQPTEEPA